MGHALVILSALAVDVPAVHTDKFYEPRLSIMKVVGYVQEFISGVQRFRVPRSVVKYECRHVWNDVPGKIDVIAIEIVLKIPVCGRWKKGPR
jgi:hypothetical protein